MSHGCRTHYEELSISSTERFQLIDITGMVEEVVSRSGVERGICLVYAPHATAAIIANEHEAGLIRDMIDVIKTLFPPDKPWRHNRIDDNAHAHLASAIIGASRIFPVRNGRLIRGTWQNIFLVELDGPRSTRRIIVEVLGEG